MNVTGSVHNLKGKVNIGYEINLVQAKFSTIKSLLEEAGENDNLMCYAKLNAKIYLYTRVSNLNESTSLNDKSKQVISKLDVELKEIGSKIQTSK